MEKLPTTHFRRADGLSRLLSQRAESTCHTGGQEIAHSRRFPLPLLCCPSCLFPLMEDVSTDRHLKWRAPAFVPRFLLTFTQLQYIIVLLSLIMGETRHTQERIFFSSQGLCLLWPLFS